jgi:hypothetical protein
MLGFKFAHSRHECRLTQMLELYFLHANISSHSNCFQHFWHSLQIWFAQNESLARRPNDKSMGRLNKSVSSYEKVYLCDDRQG